MTRKTAAKKDSVVGRNESEAFPAQHCQPFVFFSSSVIYSLNVGRQLQDGFASA